MTSSADVPIEPVDPSIVTEVNKVRISSVTVPVDAFKLCFYFDFWKCLLAAETLAGAGEDCFRGLFYEVSLALVGVASPA